VKEMELNVLEKEYYWFPTLHSTGYQKLGKDI
jgi:hypothetical protein